MAPCVTALGEAFFILTCGLTKIHMCVQLEDASIGFIKDLSIDEMVGT